MSEETCDRIVDALDKAEWVRVEYTRDGCKIFIWHGGPYVDVCDTNFVAETALAVDHECPSVEQAIQGYFGLEETLEEFLETAPLSLTDDQRETLSNLAYEIQAHAIDRMTAHLEGECRCHRHNKGDWNACLVGFWLEDKMRTRKFIEELAKESFQNNKRRG